LAPFSFILSIMKINFRCLILILAILTSTRAFALESISLPITSFDLKSNNIFNKLEMVANDPEGLLVRFKPAGLKLLSKSVHQNKIEMQVTKTIMLIKKEVFLAAVLDNKAFRTKNPAEFCYDINLDFAGSDSLVTSNVDSLNLVFCGTLVNESFAKIKVWPKIIKGQNFHSIIGPIATDIIGDQINPMIQSIKLGVQAIN